MTFDTIIKGGTIVTATDTFIADIGIRNGRIAAIGEALEEAEATIDATGRLVMPGDIDSHVHIAQPGAPEVVMAEDFATRTIDQENLHHGCDYTPYQGLEVTGWPVMTMLRGKVVTDDGALVNDAPDGQYLVRERSPLVSSHQAL